MAEFPALPLWTDAYLGDTTHLTTIEHGAYLLLLMTAWRTRDCRLPDDDRLLGRYARCNAAQWKRLRPILEPFFRVEDGLWTQPRLLDEREAVKRFRQSQSDKGSKGGKAKALKYNGRHVAQTENGHSPAIAQPQPECDLPYSIPIVPLDKESNGGEFHKTTDPDTAFWANAKAYLAPYVKGDPGTLIGKWLREQGKEMTARAITAAQVERAAQPIEYIQGYFRKHRSDDGGRPEWGGLSVPC